jgi:hypothetical protein
MIGKVLPVSVIFLLFLTVPIKKMKKFLGKLIKLFRLNVLPGLFVPRKLAGKDQLRLLANLSKFKLRKVLNAPAIPSLTENGWVSWINGLRKTIENFTSFKIRSECGKACDSELNIICTIITSNSSQLLWV